MRISTGASRALASRTTKLLAGSVLATAMLAVTGCAGSAGAGGGGQTGGEGYEYGASQDEINEAIADLEPVKLTYQVGSPSENSVAGRRSMDYKKAVEEASNGQIELEIIWGMAVAGYPEAVDAVVDGRVDISYHLVSYEPQRFPEASAIGTALGSVPYSPLVGEMVANAVGSEIGWNDQALLDRYEAEGVTVLSPILANGAYSLNCNSEINTAEVLKGKQVRAGSAPQSQALDHFGAVPTSLEFTEAFEALQRGTVDCDLSPMSAKEISGIYEAAPHLAYSTRANWPRFSATYLAGQKFNDLPLAYKQIIFDAGGTMVSGSTQSYVDSNAVHVADLASVDGTIDEFDDEFQDELGKFLIELQDASVEEGHLPEDIKDQVSDLTDKWTQRVADLGYEDEGSMEEMDDWYSADDDWSAFAKDVYENTGALDHRPTE
ncbi:C4-dicarboxylate ABC transporter substrate-binding protein [uncultured Brevibacterium sp.]|mgnify:CR=1 FL=1|uniref:C4-dicarboxylate ABC transporter substrate-binding protein n=1 Tax=uncultured Brevibacterium sp. TaxID=189678 RepID=UPI0025D26FC9|nr:C4-dicarboxylate ABC transporter substrate-binding protein [uncultured Brevibacterium sp.]